MHTDAGDKNILSNVYGICSSGQVAAVMGKSGAGKSTLMNALVGAAPAAGSLQGSVRVGFANNPGRGGPTVAYVEQFSHLVPQQTVLETLQFSAALRLPPSTCQEESDTIVLGVLRALELDGIKDRVVGYRESGGLCLTERKKVAIAAELVARPSVVLLDEPTTGLDSVEAAHMMRVLRKLADGGLAVLISLH